MKSVFFLAFSSLIYLLSYGVEINQSTAKTNQHRNINNESKFAYITMLHGLDSSFQYRGFLYNCLITKSLLDEFGSKADFIVMVGFTSEGFAEIEEIKQDLKTLTDKGITLYYLPRLFEDHVIKRKGYQNVSFAEMALLKITPYNFTQYERVQYLDADIIPHRDMDCFFSLNRVTHMAGTKSPLNSGWALILPNRTDYLNLLSIARRKRLDKNWIAGIGWGRPMPPGLYTRDKVVPITHWGFNGASGDQGLLIHYFVLGAGRIQLIHSTVVWVVEPEFHVRKRVSVLTALACCQGTVPVQFFYHFTGMGKPWQMDLSSTDKPSFRFWAERLDHLQLQVNSSTISSSHLRSPLGYLP